MVRYHQNRTMQFMLGGLPGPIQASHVPPPQTSIPPEVDSDICILYASTTKFNVVALFHLYHSLLMLFIHMFFFYLILYSYFFHIYHLICTKNFGAGFA